HPAAKCATVWLREIPDLPGSTPPVPGFDAEAVSDAARAKLVAELAARPVEPDARMKIIWYCGHTPEAVGTADDAIEAISLSSSTMSFMIGTTSVITAIGFHGADTEQLLKISHDARETGRVADGLYAAGWLRRGPVGTIPS
ncbi:hypothetical protein QT23_00115, partial [Staphylococcus aureus]